MYFEKECDSPGFCQQQVYKTEERCYYHQKIKDGLIERADD